MTITIDLHPELEQALRRHAGVSGQDVQTFVLQAVKEKIARVQTFDEVCEPFARAVQESGLSDEEFERFVDEARQEVWQEKQDRSR